MSLNCRVFRDEKGQIDFVNAPNGNRSKLFDRLVNITGGNKNTALNIYALTETEELKDAVKAKINSFKERFKNVVKIAPSYSNMNAPIEEVRFSKTANTSGYFSNALSAISNLSDKNPKNTQGWIKQLTDVQKNGGVKNVNQELQWIGLEDYLNNYVKENNPKAGNIPSSVVEDYIKSNQIEIINVSKGKPEIDINDLEAEFDGSGFKIRYYGEGRLIMPYITLDQIDLTEEDTYEEDFDYYSAQEAAKEAAIAEVLDREDGEVKYSGYQLKGGENYREVLLTMPNKSKERLIKEGYEFIQGLKLKYSIPQQVTGQELKYYIEEKATEKEISKYYEYLNSETLNEKGYKSSHWDESNILAHVRMNEKTLPDGRRVLIVNEIQSDWAQEGRKVGFINKELQRKSNIASTKYKALQEELTKIKEEKKLDKDAYQRVLYNDGKGYTTNVDEYGNVTIAKSVNDFGKQLGDSTGVEVVKEEEGNYRIYVDGKVLGENSYYGSKEVAERTIEERKNRVDFRRSLKETVEIESLPSVEQEGFRVIQDYYSKVAPLERQIAAVKRDIIEQSGIQPMPYTNTDQWVGLATRRIIQMAAQEGYDGVAFATGQQSADMYSLSQQVDKINIGVLRNKKTAEIFLKNGTEDMLFIDDEGIIVDSVKPSYKGKKAEDVLGKDLTKKILETTEDTTLEGEGLEFGGEGMKTFYDKIVPKVVQKEAQRFDKNAKLEIVDFGGGDLKVVNLGKDKDFPYFAWVNSYGEQVSDGFSTEEQALKNKPKNIIRDKLHLAQQPFIAITDKMRSELQEAIPLFSKNKGEQAPKEVIQEVTDRLKQSGLAKNVYQMSNSEIEAKLIELGVSPEIAKQVTLSESDIVSADYNSEEDYWEVSFQDGSYLEVYLSEDSTKDEVKKEAMLLVKEYLLDSMPLVYRGINGEFSPNYKGVQYFAVNKRYAGVFGRNIEEFRIKSTDILDLDDWNKKWGVEKVDFGQGLLTVHQDNLSNLKEWRTRIKNSLFAVGVEVSKEELDSFMKEVEDAKIIKGEDIGNIGQIVFAVKDKSLVEPINKDIQFSKDLAKGGAKLNTAGFTYQGDVYLNTDVMGLDTPIHEFGHLHLDWLKENRTDLYKAGLSLIKKNKDEAKQYIDIVKQTQPDLKEGTEKFNNEVLAQVIGDQGARLVNSKKDNSIADWLKNVWEAIRDILGLSNYTAEQVANMTLAEFGTASAAEMLSGKNITSNIGKNNTGKTQSFFSDVVNGTSEKYKAKKDWVPLLEYNKGQNKFNDVYSKFKGNFDNHIATSIPTFRETQVKVGNAILEMLPKGSLVYDIGGSEGGFVKTITSLSKGDIKTINLDVNEDMGAAHNAVPVEGSKFVNEAFYEGYTDEDTGKIYKRHIPGEKADVVHESMVFQFITPEREQFIKEIKNNYLKKDGIVLLEEKLVPATDKEWLQNEALKDKYKLQFYTQEEISGKSEEVLAGMRKNQTAVQELLKALKSEFKYVEQYWEAGNFKGFIATDNKDKINTFLEKLGGKIEFTEDLVPPQVESISPENSSNYANLTEDGQGNFVFYHVGNSGYETIKRSSGGTTATSREEAQALSKVGGLAMYYTKPEDGETMVTGESKYMVKIPMGKVYDFNTDSLGLTQKAKELHSKEHPGKAFDANTQVAYVTKLAGELGYEMVVAEWANRTRAQSIKELAPVDTQVVEGSSIRKPFQENYDSNSTKGFKSVIPIPKDEQLKQLYLDLNNYRNRENRYDNVYRLYEENTKLSREEITDRIKNSDLPQEYKSKYESILNTPEERRRSTYPISKSVKREPSLELNGTRIFAKERVNPITGENMGDIEWELIESTERGQGNARKAAELFLNGTDAQGKDVYLAISPRDAQTSPERLESFYSSLGFKKVSDFEMIRKAKPITPKDIDSNGEVSVKALMDFSNSKVKPLGLEGLKAAKNAAMALKVKSSDELIEKMEKALMKNGIVLFDKLSLQRSKLYNAFEINTILSSPSLQKQIKESLLSLKNSEPFQIDYNENFIVPQGREVNQFGKQEVLNPSTVEKDLIESIAGLSEDEIDEALPAAFSNRYYTDSDFRETVDSIARDYKKAPVKEIVEGELVDKTEDVKGMLTNTLTEDFNESIAEDIRFLREEIDEDIFNSNLTKVSKILNKIKKNAYINGIDLRNFPTLALELSRSEILGFLDSMEDMLSEPYNQDAFDEFSDRYFEILGEKEPKTEVIKSNSQNDVFVDEPLSEYEMFSKFGLVKKQDNVYRKVTDTPLETLYENFFEHKNLLPEGVDSIDDLKMYVQKNTGALEVSDYEVDVDNLEKMFLYKKFFGFPMSTVKPKVSTEGFNKLTNSEEYLKEDFVKEFNKWILATGNPYFKVTSKGIELTQKDELSKSEAIASVPVRFKQDLAEYNIISNNLNLELPLEEEKYRDINTQYEDRQNVVNNPDRVKKVAGQYTYLKDGVLAVKNEGATFVRTPIGVFEKIFEFANIKFYGKLDTDTNKGYKKVVAEAPFSDIRFNDYMYLENTPEAFKDSKNYYSRKELDDINKDYFECQ